MREKIVDIIKKSLEELNEDLELEELKNPSEDTVLFGSKGMLSSLDLVNLIVIIEEKIALEFSKEILLADERAMSQRMSPFVQVKRLAGYIENLLTENEDE